MNLKKLSTNFSKGVFQENPVIGLMLGLCSTLAISTEVKNAVGMGFAMTFVLLGSNILISMLRKTIPAKIRLPVFIVVIASFTTMIDLIMNAYTPSIHKNLGIFIPLIVVNCIIIARAEAYAIKHNISDSIIDALGMGFGYTLVLVILAGIREFLGNGTLLGINSFSNIQPILIMLLPPGAFITLGLMIAFMRTIRR